MSTLKRFDAWYDGFPAAILQSIHAYEALRSQLTAENIPFKTKILPPKGAGTPRSPKKPRQIVVIAIMGA